MDYNSPPLMRGTESELKEACDHLRRAWLLVYLDPLWNSPANRRKRAAICDKMRAWRIK